MTLEWQKLFTQAEPAWKDAWRLAGPLSLSTLGQLRHFLDMVHIKYCLVKPFIEYHDYPLVETRELLPSFEADLWEHKKLSGFSLVAFARPVRYFSEVFQFDNLKALERSLRVDHAQEYMHRNLGVLQSRLPRVLHDHMRQLFHKADVTDLAEYPQLIPFLCAMDRAQVLGLHGPHPGDMKFYLAGLYASFPSDLDTEVKRYGLRIGKFKMDDHDAYERNRVFVLQHLMELYGYPVASERRTSAALFARRLHKMGERFLIRTLGQSDRTLSTLYSSSGAHGYPRVDKIALTSVEDNQDGILERLYDGGYLLDEKRQVVILKVVYRQHKFSPDNVRQERALSVHKQGVIHPLTGEFMELPGLIRDTTNMFLRLNDIVRGEHMGRIIYKRNEIVEDTDTEEKRLKFLCAWLSKHQRRMIGYSEEFFANIGKVLDGYILSSDSDERFNDLEDLYQEVRLRYSYILQARKVRLLEDLQLRQYKGERISYGRMLSETVLLMRTLKFEIVTYFDSLVNTAIVIGESMLNDRYLLRSYIEKPDDELTQNGLEIKRNYGKLVTLIDDFKSIREIRADAGQRQQAQAAGAVQS
ncbi:hypothetical protein LJC15_03720 [Desulfovibrio sp. OttesenSCG-928-G11]|nr:hypothetical protein [Desulfovibrio sp. OttesenSCG-928-G11]